MPPAYIESSTQQSGVPIRVEDAAVIQSVATIVNSAT